MPGVEQSMPYGPINRRAPRERIRLDATSWVDRVQGFVRDADQTFERLLHGVKWQQSQTIRGGRKIDDPRLDGRLSPEQVKGDPTFHLTPLILQARYRIPRMSGPQLVYYRNGRDSMAPHRDDELRWLDQTIVAGLAFGATRPLILKPRRGGAAHELLLASGDLYVMGGRCQADWLHGVLKQDHCAPKISAVWRWTSRRGRPVPIRRDGP